jgi:hypothetical protein
MFAPAQIDADKLESEPRYRDGIRIPWIERLGIEASSCGFACQTERLPNR